MKKLLLLLTAGATTMTQAAITEVHLYELGEADSFHSGPKFKDSISNNNFIGHGLDPILITTNNPSPISSTYAHFDNTASSGSNYAGNYGADFSGFATDNFAVELWVRTSDVTIQGNGGDIAEIFRMGTGNQSLEFYLRGEGDWQAGYKNVAFIGGASAAVANEWVNLAVIRNSGTSAFYVDGVQIGSTTSVAPINNANAGHLSIGSGASNTFTGDIDNIRMFTFEAGDDPVAALTVSAVPEPSSSALLGLGGVALIMRRRK